MASILTLNSLLTLAETKDYLGDTGEINHTQYNNLINMVSARFNSYTGRKLKKRIYSSTAGTTEDYDYSDGNGKNYIYLKNYPITSAASEMSIFVDEDRAYSSTADQITTTDIMIYKDKGMIRVDDDTFDVGERNVRIKYAAGYTVASTSAGSTAGTIPPDLDYAAKEMIRFYRNRENDNQVGIRSESVEGQTRTFVGEMPYSVKTVLDSYRDHRSG